ncbi:hypothetical protein O6H91_18G057600 [Diphasiastrum complanatum]|uniref:Uncharacterized protein n=1 Tax=Diphasiastrum complanatum TaxID=34168 RepID=A0ACC2B1L7_DIPCM|nr:hypothetical protein O6H91_18G057600 [Diphasiastrum complanatum]
MAIVAMAFPRRHAHASPSSFANHSPASHHHPPPASFYPRALPLAISMVLLVCLLLPLQNRIVSVETLVAANAKDHGQALKFVAQNWELYTLEEAVTAVAKNGTVIVCVVTYPYLAFLVNWLVSVARQGRQDSVLVIAEDYKLLRHVNKHWPGHAVLVPPVLPASEAQRFGSEGFFNFTSRRPHHLLRILELGYSVLYNDVDMVWLADPFPYFQGEHEVYFMDDMTAIKPSNHSHALPAPGRKGRTYICSCLLFMRSSPGAKLLLRKWIEELHNQSWTPRVKPNDQPAFNWALNKTFGEVKLFLLPQESFPSGGLYFKNKTWQHQTSHKHVLIHNNYITGFDKKIKRFTDSGLWLLNNDTSKESFSNLQLVANFLKMQASESAG